MVGLRLRAAIPDWLAGTSGEDWVHCDVARQYRLSQIKWDRRDAQKRLPCDLNGYEPEVAKAQLKRRTLRVSFDAATWQCENTAP